MITEKSAGAIIYNLKNKKFLLLFRKANEKYKESWDFPRGLVEEEDEKSTVEREILEETGIEVMKFIPKFREIISFFYRKDNELIKKEIIYYLIETIEEKVELSHEHNDFKWLEFEEAIKLLTHKSSKDILKKADEFLKENSKQKTLGDY
ncbi:NUDIX domain-containing protein [Candidatus Woesearchaeota archaeon]|nr:NUDIX domain-containing protein [Candidatus Woesearchaeota archaeon]